MNGKRFIAIAGNIGSGKTTLTQRLSDHYSFEPHFESVSDNPYLSDFYSDMPRWSLQLQVFFLSKRVQAHQKILKSNGSSIQDRSIYEDAHIFARALHDSGKMEPRDYQNYLELYHTVTHTLTAPDLVLYVRRSVKTLRKQIALRGRDFERSIPEDYLSLLSNCYEEWIQEYKMGKVLTLDAEDLDLRSYADFDYVCKSIESCLEQPELFYVC
jgi:deoxyadenosine/deoxycytidine kinase